LRRRCLQRFRAPRADRDIDTLPRQAKAIALPMPALAPVTSACFPFIWRSMWIPRTSSTLGGAAGGVPIT